jgi:hypothetical protein
VPVTTECIMSRVGEQRVSVDGLILISDERFVPDEISQYHFV